MIGGILELIRTAVLAPQSQAPTPAADRVYEDTSRSPMNVQRATAEIVGLTSTPIRAEIGSGFGGVAIEKTITLRHVAALVLTVQGASRAATGTLRDRLVTDLTRRALLVDWVNADIGAEQEVVSTSVTIEYADLESEKLAAYATLVFTVDTEWTV